MSIVTEILEYLWENKIYYKGVEVNLLGIPTFCLENKKAYYSTLSRLHKKGLVEHRSGNWKITRSGEKYLIDRKERLSKFDSNFTKKSPKNLLLMFDIPKGKERERKWFWVHLRNFQYVMVQKSVWVGPSPLPKEFTSYLKEVGLKKCIKTFKLAKPYKIEK